MKSKIFTITENGTFPIPADPSWQAYSLYIQGADGSATLSLEKDGVAVSGIVPTVPFSEKINAGAGVQLDLEVTGGAAINLTVEIGALGQY